MLFVQRTPASPHRLHIPELGCRRRTTEFHEGRVRAVPKIEQVRVDPADATTTTVPEPCGPLGRGRVRE